MRLRIIIILIIAFASSFFNARAQQASDNQPPRWMKGDFPHPGNNSYEFKDIHSNGKTLAEARESAISILVMELAQRAGVVISEGKTVSSIVSRQTTEGNYEEDSFNTQFTIDYNGLESAFGIVDEYWKRSSNNNYDASFLFVVSTQGAKPQFDRFEKTSRYGVIGLWRSAIVPGWGQLYKGQKSKGFVVLGGTVALAGGIIAFENMRADYQVKMNQTQDINQIKSYSNNMNTMETFRNVCIGGVAALYIYNLIDAIVANGPKRIKIKPLKSSGISLMPVASPSMGGIHLSYRF